MFSRLFKWRYCRIFSKRFLGMIFWTAGTPRYGFLDQKSLVSGRDLIPNNTFNAMNALISSHVVSYQLGSGFVRIHCWAFLFVSSTIFAKSSSGQRRKKKSIAFPSSGTLEVGPVGSTKSSTSTGESSLDQKSLSSSSSLSLSEDEEEETEISDSLLVSPSKSLALSTSSASKPTKSSSSESDAMNTQIYITRL